MATKSQWRKYANGVIVRIIKQNPKADLFQLKKLIREAYPFGERAMHPYKIWCSEVYNCLVQAGKMDRKQIPNEHSPNQTELF